MKDLKTPAERNEYIINHANSKKLAEYHQKLLEDPAFANAPDDDPLNPWKDNEKLYKGNISRFDAAGLQVMSMMQNNVYSRDNPPPAETVAFVQQFLIRAMGNMELNSFLRQEVVKEWSLTDYVLNLEELESLAYFCYKTRNYGSLESAGLKIDSIFFNSENDSLDLSSVTLSQEEKFSLKEFATLSDLAKLNTTFKKFKSLNLLNSLELKKIFEFSNKASKLINYVNQENSLYLLEERNPVVIMDDIDKKKDVLQFTLDFINKIVRWITHSNHTSMLYKDNSKELFQSHIDPELYKDKLDITQTLYTDMYEINPIALIPIDKHKALEALYGENWRDNIRAKFKDIDQAIHSETASKFGKLDTDIGLLNKIALGLTKVIPFGHKQLSKNDFEEIHRKVMNGYYANQKAPKMICSEFIATTLIASFVELDQKIKEDAQEKYREKAEAEGFSKDQEIIKIPFGKHEDLTKVHPDRLLHILQESNCVQKITPKVVSQFIKSDEPKSKVEKLEASRSTHSTILVPS